MATTIDKLSELLQGRTINGTAQSTGETTVRFGDGSKLVVKTPTSSNSNSASTGGSITAVRQTDDPATLHLEMDGGSSLKIPLAESGSGIRLENKSGDAEYTAGE